MFLIKVLILISLQTLIECNNTSPFCTEKNEDPETNRLQSIFTIRDKVYIRVGTTDSKFWVYDTNTEQIDPKPILASTMFPGLRIVAFVAVVICAKCPESVSNLVIAIGKERLDDHWMFSTYRLQHDDSLVKIGRDNYKELPDKWGLRFGEAHFTVDDMFYGFFPENTTTEKVNGSNFHGFTFIPSEMIFSLKYYVPVDGVDVRQLYYRKVLAPTGQLTEWTETKIEGTPKVLNSIFLIKDKIYSIDNDAQYMPRISHEITIKRKEGSPDLSFVLKDVNIEARQFFNCYDKPTSPPSTEPLTSPIEEETTTITTEVSTTDEILNEETTTETSDNTIPEDTSPEDTIPNNTSPEETIPEDTIPNDTSPEETIPEDTSPEATIPKDTSPEETIPEDTPPATEETIDSAETEPNSEITSESDESGEPDDEYVLFWIIFFILILIIVIFLIALIFVVIYIRRQRKGDQYYGLDNESGIEGSNKPRPIVLGGSPSTTSVRSRHEANARLLSLDNGQSPSSTSMRSYHGMNKTGGSNAKLLDESPSTASIRTFKLKT